VNTQVPVGSTSVIGWVGGLLGLVPTIVTDIESGVVDFNGPQKYLAIGGLVLLAITQIGRYLQAHALISNSVSGVVTKVDNTAEEFEKVLPLESSVNLMGLFILQQQLNYANFQ